MILQLQQALQIEHKHLSSLKYVNLGLSFTIGTANFFSSTVISDLQNSDHSITVGFLASVARWRNVSTSMY